MEMKKCSKCGEEKELTAEYWHRRKDSKDGYRSQCKECMKNYYNNYNKNYLAEGSEGRRKNNLNSKRYYNNNKESIKEYKSSYYNNNKELISAKGREYYLNNSEHIKQKSKKYYRNNKEKYFIYASNRRARLAQLPNTLTAEEYETTLEYFNHSCAYCGCELTQDNHHMEHVVPVYKGGGTTQENIIPSCKSCNSSKHVKTLADWYRFSDDFSIERLTQIAKYLAQFTDWVVSVDE